MRANPSNWHSHCWTSLKYQTRLSVTTRMKSTWKTKVLKMAWRIHGPHPTPTVLVSYSKLVASVPFVQQMTHHGYLISGIGYKMQTQMKERVRKRKKD